MRIRTLFVGLTVSLASGLPLSDLSNHNILTHEIRDPAVKTNTPTWKVVVLCISGFIAFMSIGLIGGACEYILCAKRKRAPDYDPTRVDFDSRNIPGTPPQIGSDQATLIGNRSISDERTGTDEKHGRYSWRDERGITTEVYMDGAIPGAGPEGQLCQPRDVPSTNRGFEATTHVSSSSEHPVYGHETPQRWGGGPVSPLSPEEPQFVVHDEQDDHDYQQEMSAHPGRLVGYYDPATTVSSDPPPKREPTAAEGAAWEDISVSPLRNAHHSDHEAAHSRYGEGYYQDDGASFGDRHEGHGHMATVIER